MASANDRRRPEIEFLEDLFGNLEELQGDDLDIVFELVSQNANPAASVQALAKEAAREYFRRDEIPPRHVKAAIAGTSKGDQEREREPVKRIVDELLGSVRSPVDDPVFAWRSRNDAKLDPEDRQIVEDLQSELRKDWSEEE